AIRLHRWAGPSHESHVPQHWTAAASASRVLPILVLPTKETVGPCPRQAESIPALNSLGSRSRPTKARSGNLVVIWPATQPNSNRWHAVCHERSPEPVLERSVVVLLSSKVAGSVQCPLSAHSELLQHDPT